MDLEQLGVEHLLFGGEDHHFVAVGQDLIHLGILAPTKDVTKEGLALLLPLFGVLIVFFEVVVFEYLVAH